MSTKKVTKAVVAAAGLGTRFLPQTKAMPKEMMPVIDKPIIQYIVEELVEAGIRDIIIVTNQTKRSIEDHFDMPNRDLIENLELGGEKKKHFIEEIEAIANLANFVYVRQSRTYGNGVPLLDVEHLIGDEPFIYTWGDDFIVSNPVRFKQLVMCYEKFGASVMAGIRATRPGDYVKYGYAGGKELEPGFIDIEKVLEKPGTRENSPSDVATVSGFLFTPDIFEYLHQAKSNMDPGAELYYNDALKLMLADGKRIIAAEIKNGQYFDTGDKLEYIKTVFELALKRDDLGPELERYLREKLQ